jgi:signal transduction histidine kinase
MPRTCGQGGHDQQGEHRDCPVPPSPTACPPLHRPPRCDSFRTLKARSLLRSPPAPCRSTRRPHESWVGARQPVPPSQDRADPPAARCGPPAAGRAPDRVERLDQSSGRPGAWPDRVRSRGTALAHELQRERGLTLGGLLAGRRSPGLREQRAATNQALAAYRASAAGLDVDALAPAAADELASATNRLDGLTGLRQDLNQGSIAPAAALDAYNTTIADLLNTNRGLITGIADPQLAQRVGAFVAVSRIKELAALEREQVSEVLDRGRFAPGEFRRFTSTLSTRAVLLSEFRAAADDAQRATFVDTLVGPEVQRARELQAEAIASEGASSLVLDPAEWWTVNSTEIDLLRRVEDQLGAAAVAASRSDETAARTRAGIDAAAVLVVLALAIGLSLVVVRSLLRPLGLLRSSAEEVAHSQLPSVVERLHRAEPVDLTAETQPIGIRDHDEIGQVARAFDAVHSTAVRVAAEQAALRRSVADMFLSLGRRLQALVHRQLELLDELERTEADPQQLRSLFRLDHLATRMRRNAENLLVLSGAEPVRRWSEPVPLPRVIRAASAEIEDYNRVGVMPMADVRIVGHAVSDVVHLLAELIENAAAFSPPGTRVQVSGEPAAHGYLLEVEDQGIGMSDEELELANQQLAKPATIDLASAQRLGFYVVGRLAARHTIKVRLRRSWFGGVAALVLLPASLLGGPETGMEPAGPPSDGHPEVEPGRDSPGVPRRGAPAERGEPVPTPVPRAFAVKSPGAGHDNGMAG